MKKETKWKVDAKTNKKGRIHVSEIYRWGTVWRFLRNPPARALFLLPFPLYSDHVLSQFDRLSRMKESMVRHVCGSFCAFLNRLCLLTQRELLDLSDVPTSTFVAYFVKRCFIRNWGRSCLLLFPVYYDSNYDVSFNWR